MFGDFRGRKGEREKNINWLSLVCTLTMDQTCNLGTCPDQESNLQILGVWDNTPTNWASQPGLIVTFKLGIVFT